MCSHCTYMIWFLLYKRLKSINLTQNNWKTLLMDLTYILSLTLGWKEEMDASYKVIFNKSRVMGQLHLKRDLVRVILKWSYIYLPSIYLLMSHGLCMIPKKVNDFRKRSNEYKKKIINNMEEDKLEWR